MASSSGRIYRWLSSQRFDVIGAVIGILLALAMLPLRLISTNLFILGIPLMIGTASALYLLAVRNDQTEGLPAMPIWLGRFLPSAVLLGTTLLIVLGLWQGGRTPAFYNVATLVAIGIFAQIFFTRERDFVPWLLIVQIMAFAVVIRFMALLTTPGFTGIDVWTHVPTWSASILETRSLAPLANNKYYASPLFHLLTVATSLFGGVSVRNGLFLSVGAAMALSPLFVYIAARLFVSQRWSLFALAMFATSAHTVEWSIHLIPTSLGLVFFLGVFYLLIRALDIEPGGREFLIIVVFSIGTILTHQISAFIMLVLTGAGLFAHLLLRFDLFSPPSQIRGIRPARGESVSLTGLLAFDLGFITFMWSLTPYHGDTFLATTFSFFRVTLAESEGFGDLSGDRGGTAGAAVEPTLIEQLVNYIDAIVFLLPFLVAVVGSLYILRRRNISHATFMCGVSVVLMLVFIFGFPMFGIRTFIPQRWYAFLAAPMALLAAIGLAYLARRLNPPAVVAVLLVFALLFPMASMAATDATIDNPRFETAQTKYSYEEPELNAIDTFSEIRPIDEEERYHTDHPYNTVFSRAGPGPAAAANITEEGRENTDVLIHREQQEKGTTFFVGEDDQPISPEMTRADLCGAERHYAYDNGEVTMCTATWEIDPDTDAGSDIGGDGDAGDAGGGEGSEDLDNAA